MTRHPELPERDRRILGVLVQAYIDQGEPISSLWLANRGFGVSSATLRNIMARLEEQGYVRQPHTSAGRVPTDLGYRMLRRSAACRAQVLATGALKSRRGCGEPARSRPAVACLAGGLARVASGRVRDCPPRYTTMLERLDFVPLDGGKLLVVVVAAGGHVSHKVDRADGRVRARRAAAGGQLPEPASSRDDRLSRSGRPFSSGCARSARSTMS